jgi:hypothetical protein
MSDTSSVGTAASCLEDITDFLCEDPLRDHYFDEAMSLLEIGVQRGLTSRQHHDVVQMCKSLHKKGFLPNELFTKNNVDDLYEFVKRHNTHSWLIVKRKKVIVPKVKVKTKAKIKKETPILVIDKYGNITLKSPLKIKKLYK